MLKTNTQKLFVKHHKNNKENNWIINFSLTIEFYYHIKINNDIVLHILCLLLSFL
jgi:hypothetical protein